MLLVGGRMSEMPSQSYTLFSIPEPRQTLVHVHADAMELGRVYHAALAINATPPAFCAALESLQPPQTLAWSGTAQAARADFMGWTDTLPAAPAPLATDMRMDMGRAMLWLRDRLPADAIVTSGAGNYNIWPQRFLRTRGFNGQIAATSGSMGFGTPAGVGAKRYDPSRMVVVFAGDGCFLMNGQEFATAVQYDLAIVVILVDNGQYGTIRMHQERDYPGRVSGTQLRNPDFAALARAYGGHGETVETTADFAPAFERAVASGKPAIVHVKTSNDVLTPGATVQSLRAMAKD